MRARNRSLILGIGVAAAVFFAAIQTHWLLGQSQPRRNSLQWKPLFNGHDLNDWEAVHAGDWRVENGVIIVHRKPQDTGGGWLVTRKDYGDFLLRLKFKPNAEPFNSGILVRDPAHAKIGRPAFSGFEIQIAGGYGEDTDNPSASIYDVARAYRREIGVNDWAAFEVHCIGDHIVAYMNGDKMSETHTRRSYRGGIGLQIHGGKEPVNYMFKDIEIAELPEAPRPDQLMEEKLENEPGESVPLFAANAAERELSLAGHADSVWTLQEEVLRGMGAQQVSRVFTKSVYGDFILGFTFRTNASGQAGLVLRVPDASAAVSPSGALETAGYEFRIADADDENPTGSVVNLARAFRLNDFTCMKPVHRAGEWNQARIYAEGDHLVTYVNGLKMAELHSNRSLRGHIGFEVSPGTTADFRAITIKKIASRM